MAGKKIEQARNALEYCVKVLRPGDRFNVIRFSTDVEMFAETLVEATDESCRKALTFAEGITARGGTAIDEALTQALSLDYDADRPGMILFLTDGRPTIGESDTEKILGHVAAGRTSAVRVFVFGVGDDVNTHLLDRLSGGHGGLSQYVKPGEDIEQKVSALADKMSNPVLSNVRVEVDKLKTLKVHPGSLPDLFAGDQLTVLGRYQGEGHVAIRLLGDVHGKQREFVYEGTFPAVHADNAFIPRLWATRRVGYLLDEIRLHGEEPELKEEVIALSKEHGIMTPYTSYLVLEDDAAYQRHGIERLQGWGEDSRNGFAARAVPRAPARPGAAAPEPESVDASTILPYHEAPMDSAEEADRDGLVFFGASRVARKARVMRRSASEIRTQMQTESGASAVNLSEAIREYKSVERAGEDVAGVRHVGKKTFYRIGGRWVDGEYKKEMKLRTVAFAGDAYFKLLQDMPELKPYLALGERVTVVLPDGTALAVE